MPNTPPTTEIDDLVKVSPPTFTSPLVDMPDSKDITTSINTEKDREDKEDKARRSGQKTTRFEVDEESKKEKKPYGGYLEKVEDVDVQRMVEQTVRRVREQSDKFQTAAKPFADKTRSIAERRPILFTFFVVFSVLSIIPICFFVGFILSSTVFILSVAAVGICVSVLFTILCASSILLPILFVTSLISLSILSFLLTLFLLHRLYLNIHASTQSEKGHREADYESLSRGVKAWINETTGRMPNMPFDISSLKIGPAEPPSYAPSVAKVIVPASKTLEKDGLVLDIKVKQEPIDPTIKTEVK